MRFLPFVVLSGVLLAACGPPAKVNAPLPATVADTATAADSAPGLPPTYASAPVSVDLRLLLDEVEHTIPKHIGSLEDRMLVALDPKTWVALEIERGPLAIQFGPSSMTVATTLTYKGRAWLKVPLTTISASCGTGDVQPRARVVLRSAYSMDAAWHLHTTSTVVSVDRVSLEDRDECHVTFVGIDVTKKVLEAARGAIEKELAVADSQIAEVDVRGAVTPIWASLQQPLSIRDTTLWLIMRPKAIGVGAVTVRDSIAHAMVTLMAQPKVLSGPRPAPDSLPLPNLTRVRATSDTLVTVIDGSLGYQAANEILRTELKGHKLRVRGRRVVVDDVIMSYIGRNRIALGVQLSGAVEGRVYFTGTPRYDPAADAITVPDLDYDLQTSNLLVQGITWLAGDKLRDEMRKQARLPARAMLDFVRGAANQEITRTLADGVQLSGAIGSAQALAVQATGTGFHAQARGSGKLALDIKLERVFANTHIPRHPLKGIDETALRKRADSSRTP